MIVFKDGTKVVSNSGNVIGKKRYLRGADRDSLEIIIPNTTHKEMTALFCDGAQFSITAIHKESPDSEPREVTHDQFDYVVAGDIIDKRDGTFVVYMGRKTSEEIMSEEFAAFILEQVGG